MWSFGFLFSRALTKKRMLKSKNMILKFGSTCPILSQSPPLFIISFASLSASSGLFSLECGRGLLCVNINEPRLLQIYCIVSFINFYRLELSKGNSLVARG